MRLLFLILLLLPTIAGGQILNVTLLGVGMPHPQVQRFGPAVLVEAGQRKLLFDAGRGVSQRLYQLYVPFDQVNKIFITHMHYDHLLGLPDLLLSGWVFQRKEKLDFWGPHALGAHLDNLLKAYRSDIDLRVKHTKLKYEDLRYEVHDTTQGMVYKEGDLTVTAFLVDHSPVKPAYGYRIDYAGVSVVISGDTRYSPEVQKQATGVDLLIHEVATASKSLQRNNPRLRKVLAYHTSPEDLGKLLNNARPKLTVLTHVISFGVMESELLQRVSKGYNGAVKLGADLMSFDIGKEIIEYTRPR